MYFVLHKIIILLIYCVSAILLSEMNELFHPYLVIFIRKTDSCYSHSGTLINERWVITRATALSYGKEWLVAGAGDNFLDISINNITKFHVDSIIFHPDYDFKLKHENVYDLALARIDKPITVPPAIIKWVVADFKYITNLTTVYWHKTFNNIKKEYILWEFTENDRCIQELYSNYLCLSANISFPCRKDTWINGAPVVIRSFLFGIYLGYSNSYSCEDKEVDENPTFIAIAYYKQNKTRKWLLNTINFDTNIGKKSDEDREEDVKSKNCDYNDGQTLIGRIYLTLIFSGLCMFSQ